LADFFSPQGHTSRRRSSRRHHRHHRSRRIRHDIPERQESGDATPEKPAVKLKKPYSGPRLTVQQEILEAARRFEERKQQNNQKGEPPDKEDIDDEEDFEEEEYDASEIEPAEEEREEDIGDIETDAPADEDIDSKREDADEPDNQEDRESSDKPEIDEGVAESGDGEYESGEESDEEADEPRRIVKRVKRRRERSESVNPAEKAYNILISPLFPQGRKLKTTEAGWLLVAWMGIIVLPAAILLGGWAREFPTADSISLTMPLAMDMAQTARNCKNGKGLTTYVLDPLSMRYQPRIGGHWMSRHAPGYPLFISALMGWFRDIEADTVILGLGAILWLMTGWIVYGVVMRWGDRIAAFFALGLIATNGYFLRASLSGVRASFLAFQLALVLSLASAILIPLFRRDKTQAGSWMIVDCLALGLAIGLMAVASVATLLLTVPLAIAVGARAVREGGRMPVTIAVGAAIMLMPLAVYSVTLPGVSLLSWPGIALQEMLGDALVPSAAVYRLGWLPCESVLGNCVIYLFRIVLKLPDSLLKALMVLWLQVGLVAGAAFVANTFRLAGSRRRRHRSAAGSSSTAQAYFLMPLVVGAILTALWSALISDIGIELSMAAPLFAIGGAGTFSALAERLKRRKQIRSLNARTKVAIWNLRYGWPVGHGMACVGLAVIGLMPLTGQDRPRWHTGKTPPEVDFLKRNLAKMGVKRQLLASDMPERVAWHADMPVVRLPVFSGDLAEAAMIAGREGRSIDGFLLSQPGEAMSSYFGADWLDKLYSNVSPVCNTFVVTGSRFGMMYRLAGRPVVAGHREPNALLMGRDEVLKMFRYARWSFTLAARGLRERDPLGVFFSAARFLGYEEPAQEFLLFQVRYHLLQRDFAGGIAKAGHLVRLSPDYPRARAEYARALAVSGDFSGAYRHFRAALSKDINVRLDWPLYLETLVRLGRVEDAEKGVDLLGRIWLNRKIPLLKARMNQVMLCGQVGLHRHAIKIANTLRDMFPENPQVHRTASYLLAVAYANGGGYADAIPILNELVSKWPDWQQPRFDLAVSYRKIGDWENAETQYRLWAKTDGEKLLVFRCLAAMCGEKGDREAAIKISREGLAAFPDDLVLLNNMASAMLSEGASPSQLKESESIARGLVARQPSDIRFADTLAWGLMRQGRAREAEEVMKPFFPAAWREPEIAFHAGSILAGMGRNDAAARLLKAAIEKAPLGAIWLKQARQALEDCEAGVR